MFKQRERKQPNIISKLSPLDEVRQEEARVASQILLARQEAEAAKQASVLLAQQKKTEAQQAGLEAGQISRAQAIKETTLEAQALIEKAHAEAETIVENGRQSVPKAALWVIRVVLGLETEERKP